MQRLCSQFSGPAGQSCQSLWGLGYSEGRSPLLHGEWDQGTIRHTLGRGAGHTLHMPPLCQAMRERVGPRMSVWS